jgi:hypothetical protein
MGCSCHISPPCSYCLETYECAVCNEIKHPDDSDPTWVDGEPTCSECKEKNEIPDDKREQ